MSEKTFVVTEDILQAALSDARARIAAANEEIDDLAEKGYTRSNSNQGRHFTSLRSPRCRREERARGLPAPATRAR